MALPAGVPDYHLGILHCLSPGDQASGLAHGVLRVGHWYDSHVQQGGRLHLPGIDVVRGGDDQVCLLPPELFHGTAHMLAGHIDLRVGVALLQTPQGSENDLQRAHGVDRYIDQYLLATGDALRQCVQFIRLPQYLARPGVHDLTLFCEHRAVAAAVQQFDAQV